MVIAAAVGALPARGQVQAQSPDGCTFHDALGTEWTVTADGSIGAGSVDVYDAGGKLFIGGNSPYAPDPAGIHVEGPTAVSFPSQNLEGLNVSRRVYVDATGAWCRWIEILQNPGAATVNTTVRVNFTLGSPAQTSMPLNEAGKRHRQRGLVVFDGARGIAMIGAGVGSAVAPVYSVQPNTNQVDVSWSVRVAPHRSAAIVHVQAVRSNLDGAQAVANGTPAHSLLTAIPQDLLRDIVNFPTRPNPLGDIELLRGDQLDVVELRGDDHFKGTLLDKTFSLRTPYGVIALPADQVGGMVSVGEVQPLQMLITRDGQAFCGAMEAPAIHLQLTNRQVTAIPVSAIRRFGYRRSTESDDSAAPARPLLILQRGDRIAIDPPTEDLPFATRFGALSISAKSIALLEVGGEEQSVHQVTLVDGSRFAGVMTADALHVRPIALGGEKAIAFPLASIAALQLSGKIDEPAEDAPTLALAAGDRLVGTVAGELSLQTAFDVITAQGSQVKAITRAGAAGEVQVTLWDDATFTGRLPSDTLEIRLSSGPTLRVATRWIDRYVQPLPLPSEAVLEKMRQLLSEINSSDWKVADRSTAALAQMGPRVAPGLRLLRQGQPAGVQERIDKILAGWPGEDPPATKAATQPAQEEPMIR